jgi:hypothetical protein
MFAKSTAFFVLDGGVHPLFTPTEVGAH